MRLSGQPRVLRESSRASGGSSSTADIIVDQAVLAIFHLRAEFIVREHKFLDLFQHGFVRNLPSR
jgi:hypothetical protein